MADDLYVRALDRGLDVLEFLGANGPSSLHRIHSGTGLPKSSLRRLLNTLVERRFIRVGISDGMYRTNIGTIRGMHSPESTRIGRLIEIARPHMLELTDQARWPVDLHICMNGRMRIIESTHGLSPFGSAHDVEADLNMFVAASGLAYLAALSDAEVARIIDYCQTDPFTSPERYGITKDVLLAWIKSGRKAGYAERRTSQLREDKRNAIAVAILDNKKPVGALAMAWPREFMTVEDFAARHISDLKEAASRMNRGLARAQR